MVLPLVSVLVFPIVIVFFIRAFHSIVFKSGKRPEKTARTKPAKTLIILGSGGHTTEILRIVQQLNKKNYSPRIYLQAKTDEISAKKVMQLEANSNNFKVIEIARSREVRQSYVSSVFTTIQAILQSFPLIWKEKPDLLLCNGPGTCIPPCLVAFFFNALFLSNIKIVFIESFCRVKSFSLSGKILYYLAHHIIVQWPYLNGSEYPRSIVMAHIIAKLLQWNDLYEDLNKQTPNELKFHLNQVFVRLENFYKNNKDSSQVKKLKFSFQWVESDLFTTDACLDRVWEMLNSGYWKDVPVNYRYCYSLSSILKSMLLELSINVGNEYNKINKYKEIIKQIDKGVLLGTPLPKSPNLLTQIASELNHYYTVTTKTDEKLNEIEVDKEKLCIMLLPGFLPVSHFNKPSMETFYCDIFKPKVPALLEGCIGHWRALHLWKDVNYLLRIAGNRTVPIELGYRYTEDDWTQSLITFSDFLKTYISKKSNKVGYLAQHQLFDQIPELKNDFFIPDYCSFSDKDECNEEPDINAWFGPEGTVSPLHYDPKNNFLCQIFGYKRIILYSPDDSINLYPYETRLLCNTARVDPYNLDYEKFPNFKKAKGYMCFLKPGDMLFIPPRWWHHVTGLTSSFSISFWWD